MTLIIFDSNRFIRDVSQALADRGWGARQDLIRVTGVPRTTFQRMLNHEAGYDISHITSIAAHLELEVTAYLVDSRRKG